MRFQYVPQAVALIAVLVTATAGFVVLSNQPDERPSPSPVTSSSPSTSPSPSATSAQSPTPAVVTRPVAPSATIDIGGSPWQLRVTDDGIWASVGSQLVRIDPATNEVTERIDVPDAGSSCPECTGGERGFWSFAIDGRAAWASFHIDGASLVRKVSLDDGRIIADIPIEANGGEDVAVAFGSVWVSTCHASQVVRIDRTSNEVVGTVSAEDGPNLGDCNAMYLGVGAGSVWTAFGGGAAGRVAYVVRIDPETLGTTTIHTQSGPSCGQMAVTDDDLWVANCPGLTGQSIARIDPRTNAEVGFVRFVDGYPGQPVIDGELVWVPVVGISSGSLSIVAIDRASGEIVDEIDPGTTVRTRGTSAASAVAGFGSLWVNGADGSLLRVSRDDLRP